MTSQINMKLLLKVVLIFLCVNTQAMAEIYKWVDERGVTHFGQNSPENVEAEKLNINIGIKRYSDSLKPESNPTQAGGEQVTFSCRDAVNNAKRSIDNLMTVAKLNLKDGHINQPTMDMKTAKMKKLDGGLSINDCQSAQGARLEFYYCMSQGLKTVEQCG